MKRKQQKGATGVAYGLVVGLIAIVALGAITEIGLQVDGLFGTVSTRMDDLVTAPASPEVTPDTSSCFTILANNPTASSGAYTITPGGESFDVQCDMSTDGGGWTRVVLQSSANVADMWNMWSADENTAELDGQINNAGLAMSRLSSTSNGADMELMWEVNNSPRRIYRGVPLSIAFNNDRLSDPGPINVEHKSIGGSYVAFIFPTSNKGGWYNGYNSNTANDNDMSFFRCGWGWGHATTGGLYGVSADAACGVDTGFNNLSNPRVELWLR